LEYAPSVARVARETGVEEDLIWAVMYVESTLDPNAVGPAGPDTDGHGLMQVTLGTAGDLMEANVGDGTILKADPDLNIELGARYLAEQYRRFGNWPHAISAYNQGPGNLQRNLEAGGPLNNQAHVDKVMKWWKDQAPIRRPGR